MISLSLLYTHTNIQQQSTPISHHLYRKWVVFFQCIVLFLICLAVAASPPPQN